MKYENEKQFRVNNQIRFSPVIVIDQNGKNLGPTPLQRANEIARESGLDLVEISPSNKPPICKIMDFGKFKFDQNLKEKKQRKKQQKQSQAKELRLSPSIQQHDIETKIKSAIKFLSSGYKLNLKLEFKRREIAHQDIGLKVINSFINQLEEHGDVVAKPKSDGKNLFCSLEPKRNVK